MRSFAILPPRGVCPHRPARHHTTVNRGSVSTNITMAHPGRRPGQTSYCEVVDGASRPARFDTTSGKLWPQRGPEATVSETLALASLARGFAPQKLCQIARARPAW